MVPIRHRVIAALGVGLLAGLLCWLLASREGAVPDLLAPLTAARRFLGGENPYWTALGPMGKTPFDEPLFYPFTTVLAVLPFAHLTTAAASGLFFGASSGLLAFFITRDGLWRLHVFASAPFVVAATLAQLSPLLCVAAFVPAAGFLAVLKPNLGLALLVRRPSVKALLGCAVLVAISVAILPSWPADWMASLRKDVSARHIHLAPILQWQWGGALLMLAAFGWRRPAGRLLLAMSCVPQLLFFYDQLPLWLVPRTRKESILLTACSQLAMILWFLLRETGDSLIRSGFPYVVALIYLPALAIMWRHRRDAPHAEPAAIATMT